MGICRIFTLKLFCVIDPLKSVVPIFPKMWEMRLNIHCNTFCLLKQKVIIRKNCLKKAKKIFIFPYCLIDGNSKFLLFTSASNLKNCPENENSLEFARIQYKNVVYFVCIKVICHQFGEAMKKGATRAKIVAKKLSTTFLRHFWLQISNCYFAIVKNVCTSINEEIPFKLISLTHSIVL